MAIVKVLFRKDASKVIRYVFEHSQVGDQFDSENCPPYVEGACAEFEAIRNLHHYKEGRNQALHIVQSWDESDSKKLTPKQVNEMGRSLVEEYFKGHQFVIATHTETGKFHNHIVVSTMHMETGKHVERKNYHLYKLRKINDKICLECGLKIPNQEAIQRRASVPQKVQNMTRAGRESWIMDIRTKADVARHLATSYDQYVSYMDALGIQARVENENITYFYPGRSRGKRGSKMGKVYDKAGLETQFKKNDERFQEKPEIRQQLWADYSHLTQAAAHPSGVAHATTSVEKRDYSTFTKVPRGQPRTTQAIHSDLSRGIIPIEEIQKAKRSILDYCRDNQIPLTKNSYGHTVLRDRNYIVIEGDHAKNTRNGTRATLIDFVASHHHLTLLQAVAKINNNPGLLAFEQHFGEVRRKYTSFYIPKPDQMPQTQAVEHLGRFLRQRGMKSELADPLIMSQRAEVSKSGLIRLFAETDAEGALEFTPNADNSWHPTKRGTFKKPFFKRSSTGPRTLLFMEPQSYLAGRGTDLFSHHKARDGILALMEPSEQMVDHYLKENPHVKRIDFVAPKGRSLSQSELDFFGVLKKKLEPFRIEVGSVSHDMTVERETEGLSR